MTVDHETPSSSSFSPIPPPGRGFKFFHGLITALAVCGSFWALAAGGWAILALIITLPVLILSACCLVALKPGMWWLGVTACIIGGSCCLLSMGLGRDVAALSLFGALAYGYSALALISGRHGARSLSRPATSQEGETLPSRENVIPAAGTQPSPATAEFSPGSAAFPSRGVNLSKAAMPQPGKTPPGIVLLALCCVAALLFFLTRLPHEIPLVWDTFMFFLDDPEYFFESGNSRFGPLILADFVLHGFCPSFALYCVFHRRKEGVLLCLGIMMVLSLAATLSSFFEYRAVFTLRSFTHVLSFIVIPLALFVYVNTAAAASAYFAAERHTEQ
ncbi:MAG: hypothetical protein DELT_01153 [Desulfovibrio sp.]